MQYVHRGRAHQIRTVKQGQQEPHEHPWPLRDFLNPGRDELYNLENDSAESANLIKGPSPEAKRITKDLHARIIENMRRINDPMLRRSSGRMQ